MGLLDGKAAIVTGSARGIGRATAIPLGRPATPTEASGPVLFLASPLANYVHGQVLNVTGGMFGGMYT